MRNTHLGSKLEIRYAVKSAGKTRFPDLCSPMHEPTQCTLNPREDRPNSNQPYPIWFLPLLSLPLVVAGVGSSVRAHCHRHRHRHSCRRQRLAEPDPLFYLALSHGPSLHRSISLYLHGGYRVKGSRVSPAWRWQTVAPPLSPGVVQCSGWGGGAVKSFRKAPVFVFFSWEEEGASAPKIFFFIFYLFFRGVLS